MIIALRFYLQQGRERGQDALDAVKLSLYCQREFAVVARGLPTQMFPSTALILSACVCCSTAFLSPQEDFCNIWEHSWVGSCWREQNRGVCIWHWNNSPGASLILGIPQAFFSSFLKNYLFYSSYKREWNLFSSSGNPLTHSRDKFASYDPKVSRQHSGMMQGNTPELRAETMSSAPVLTGSLKVTSEFYQGPVKALLASMKLKRLSCWLKETLLRLDWDSPDSAVLSVPESAYKFHHSAPTWMTNGDRQTGDSRGGRCSISLHFLLLSETNGS